MLQKVESDTDGSKRSTSSQSHSRHRRRRSNRRRNKSEEELERERISLEQDRASNEGYRRLSKVLGPSSLMTFAFVSQSHAYLLALTSLTVGSMSV